MANLAPIDPIKYVTVMYQKAWPLTPLGANSRESEVESKNLHLCDTFAR